MSMGLRRVVNPVLTMEDARTGARCLERFSGMPPLVSHAPDAKYVPCIRREGHAGEHVGVQQLDHERYYWQW